MDNVPEEFRQRGYTEPYSKWHWEKLPKYCYMMDLDCIEVRGNKPIAIIELRSTPTPLNDWQKSIVLQIAQRLNIPAYLVNHNIKLTFFNVTNLQTEKQWILSEEEYIIWLKTI